MRLDKFLAEKNPQISRSKIQKAIKTGSVLVNGRPVLEPDFEVSESDRIDLPALASDELKPSSRELKVIFENADLAVIDKPPGLVVHPGAGNPQDTLANILIAKYPDIIRVGEPHRPGIVHRLDEDTSGLMVIAKTPAAYEYLKKVFQDRTVEKEYLALVHGAMAQKHGVIDAPLEKVPLKQKMAVGTGKDALTEYFLLANDPSLQFSLIKVKLHTGRTHQIRAHLAHIGYPLVGDAVYGRKDDLLDRQFLHAYRLKFRLPDGSWLESISELPADLLGVLEKLGIKQPYAHHEF